MFCSKCGSEIADGSLFCHQCGNRITTEIIKKSNTENSIVSDEYLKVKDYLKHAKTLEVNRYTLKATIDRLQRKITTLGIKNVFMKPESQKGDFFKPFILTLISSVLCSFLVATIRSSAHSNDSFYFIETMLIGGIWISIPLSLVIGIIVKCKKDKNRDMEYKKQVNNDNARVEAEKQQILSLKNQQNELSEQISNIENLLDKLYSSNVIYPKYRELLPIVTMWEYFDSERCTQLGGANGAYNLFESESRQDIIISNLNKAISMLEQIKETQYALYEAIQESNEIADRIYYKSEEMLSSNKKIEHNSEIAAYNAKIAAENSTISTYIDYCKW